MVDDRPRHRFYVGEELSPGSTISLSGNASEQIRKVLRLRRDDAITVFDGRGQEAAARITGLRRNQTTVAVDSEPAPGLTAGPPEIHLGVAMLKSDNFELVIQKATELGVASITPLETDRSVVSLPADRVRSRMERWRRIAIEALEQSGRSVWVDIREPVSLADAVDLLEADLKLIAWEETTDRSLVECLGTGGESVAILIGPEGGLTQSEIDAARDAGFIAVSLGDLILRSETAAISSVAVTRAYSQVSNIDEAHSRED